MKNIFSTVIGGGGGGNGLVPHPARHVALAGYTSFLCVYGQTSTKGIQTIELILQSFSIGKGV
jgi:hypothetical protein